MGQIVATSFGVESFDIPFFGLYGACSTMGEAMILGAMAAGAGYADRVLALASSHFASAVPVSAGVWESETAVHNLDGDRVRVCDDRGK